MQMENGQAGEGSLAVLDRICATAAEICGGEAAVIAYNRAGKTRILASHGVASRFRVYQYDLDEAPFKPTQFVVKCNASADRYYSRLGAALGIAPCEFFLRAPISITETHATSLIVLSGTAVKRPTAARLKALQELAALCRDRLLPLFPLLDSDRHNASALMTRDEVINSVAASASLVGLVDDDLLIRAVSPQLAGTIGLAPDEILGRGVTEIGLQSGDAQAFLFRQALDSGVSPPEYELIKADPRTGRSVFAVNATPLTPTDAAQRFIYFTVRDVTSLSRREETLSRRFRPVAGRAPAHEEPSLRFLLDTLVRRRTLRERNGISYMTLESWRQSIRTYQIAALKALKQNVPLELSQAAARRLADEVNGLVGTSAFKFIVPVPCSNSCESSCLSLEIARSLSSLTGLPVLRCISLPQGGGSSHPRKNARRPRMSLVEKVSGPALLVDDVATSGSHLEEATKLLRPSCGAVMAVAWIGA